MTRDLDAVAVELDFVEPTLAGRHFFDRRRQRRLDEARKGTLDADGWRLVALEGHGSYQPQGELALVTLMRFNKVENR